jgi:hypothetical protein
LPYIELDATSAVHSRASETATLLLDPSKDKDSERSTEMAKAILDFQEQSFLPASKSDFEEQELKRNPPSKTKKSKNTSSNINSDKENTSPNSAAAQSLPKQTSSTTARNYAEPETEITKLKRKVTQMEGELEIQKNRYAALLVKCSVPDQQTECDSLQAMIDYSPSLFTEKGETIARQALLLRGSGAVAASE